MKPINRIKTSILWTDNNKKRIAKALLAITCSSVVITWMVRYPDFREFVFSGLLVSLAIILLAFVVLMFCVGWTNLVDWAKVCTTNTQDKDKRNELEAKQQSSTKTEA